MLFFAPPFRYSRFLPSMHNFNLSDSYASFILSLLIVCQSKLLFSSISTFNGLRSYPGVLSWLQLSSTLILCRNSYCDENTVQLIPPLRVAALLCYCSTNNNGNRREGSFPARSVCLQPAFWAIYSVVYSSSQSSLLRPTRRTKKKSPSIPTPYLIPHQW